MLESIITEITSTNTSTSLHDIELLDDESERRFNDKFLIQSALARTLVSFQANKTRPIYRWYKFKEAFSANLVEYLFQSYHVAKGICLDPFAGSGTSLFAASSLGIDSDGIELLPIGQQIIGTKKLLDTEFTSGDFETLKRWVKFHIWEQTEKRVSLQELRITKGAYPEQTRESIERYLGACDNENNKVQAVLRFALLCVLESISYTRKDGQYLRWDYRSGRQQGTIQFDKGEILSFGRALSAKIDEILTDLQPTSKQSSLFPAVSSQGDIRLYNGSCLEVLPTLATNTYNAIITSPPYCNRYDYTRTYALELAVLGADEKALSNLRQQLLSCTVENREKNLLKINPQWTHALEIADGQSLLQAILKYLNTQKTDGLLNNNGIPRMVKGYFYEMACIISECARVLKPNAPLFMVNDNVRYAGASISVDMILSSFAEQLGFNVEKILVLPNGKGNSSQQMGQHGRKELRKCVYVWRKT